MQWRTIDCVTTCFTENQRHEERMLSPGSYRRRVNLSSSARLPPPARLHELRFGPSPPLSNPTQPAHGTPQPRRVARCLPRPFPDQALQAAASSANCPRRSITGGLSGLCGPTPSLGRGFGLAALAGMTSSSARTAQRFPRACTSAVPAGTRRVIGVANRCRQQRVATTCPVAAPLRGGCEPHAGRGGVPGRLRRRGSTPRRCLRGRPEQTPGTQSCTGLH